MNELKIYTYPDPVLHTKAGRIEDIDQEVQDLIDRMAKTMYMAPGIGLAANQVGVLKRLIVFDVIGKSSERKPSVLINPEIVMAEGSLVHEEACLSVIDYSAEVTRSAHVGVHGFDREGKPLEVEAEGLLAVCLQHEIDHLNGILFIDHISSLKRSLYKRKLGRMQRDFSETV